MNKKQKNPWIAGLLNFLLPGLGYIYGQKKRLVFSVPLTLLSVWVAIHDWEEITTIITEKTGISEHFLLFIILYPVVFAYDAYKDVVEK